MSVKCRGQISYPLEQFVAKHQNAYVTMTLCTNYVAYQLPNTHSRVGYLLDGIENDNTMLLATIANVEENTCLGGE